MKRTITNTLRAVRRDPGDASTEAKNEEENLNSPEQAMDEEKIDFVPELPDCVSSELVEIATDNLKKTDDNSEQKVKTGNSSKKSSKKRSFAEIFKFENQPTGKADAEKQEKTARLTTDEKSDGVGVKEKKSSSSSPGASSTKAARSRKGKPQKITISPEIGTEEKEREPSLPPQNPVAEESPEKEEAPEEEIREVDTTYTISAHEVRVSDPIRYLVNAPRGLDVWFNYNDIMEIRPELVREYNSHYPELERAVSRRLRNINGPIECITLD